MKMNKEKFVTMTKYAEQLRSRLTDPLPIKHTHRHESYRQFLKNELEAVSKKLAEAKEAGVK